MVADYGGDSYGIRSIYLSRNVIALAVVIENERWIAKHPILSISITRRRKSPIGEMVIFYGLS